MNLLSIRGGGVKGVICTRLLMAIETITNKCIYEIFDFCGGSSVGVLITAGILVSDNGTTALYTAAELHQMFLNNLSHCFTWTYKSFLSSGFGLFGPKYTVDGMHAITHTCCADYKMHDLLKPVIFPAYDRANNKAYYFDKEKNGDLLLSDVILGATAAPTYFPSHPIEIGDKKHSMADSGLVINDCSELTYLKATQNIKILDKSKILLLNLGTGRFDQTVTTNDGLLSWIPNIVNTLMHASIENEMFELSLSLPSENYFVIDIPLDIKYYQLDNTTPEAINYYLTETEKWLNDNQEIMKAFCDKLLNNLSLK